MKDRIEVPSLNHSLEYIEQGLQLIESMNLEIQPGRFISFRLSHMKKTNQSILDDAAPDESGKLFVDSRFLPEIIWLRYSAASIIKLCHEKPESVSQELVDVMDRCFHHFDSFYQFHVAHR